MDSIGGDDRDRPPVRRVSAFRDDERPWRSLDHKSVYIAVDRGTDLDLALREIKKILKGS